MMLTLEIPYQMQGDESGNINVLKKKIVSEIPFVTRQ